MTCHIEWLHEVVDQNSHFSTFSFVVPKPFWCQHLFWLFYPLGTWEKRMQQGDLMNHFQQQHMKILQRAYLHVYISMTYCTSWKIIILTLKVYHLCPSLIPFISNFFTTRINQWLTKCSLCQAVHIDLTIALIVKNMAEFEITSNSMVRTTESLVRLSDQHVCALNSSNIKRRAL